MSSDIDVPDFLLNKKPCRILVEIGEMETPYASKLSRELEASHAHTLGVVKKLQASGLVDSEVEGRKNILSLTAEGRSVAEALENLYNVLDVGENQ